MFKLERISHTSSTGWKIQISWKRGIPDSYDLRKNNCIKRRIIKSCKYGSETVWNLGAKLCDILPEKYLKS